MKNKPLELMKLELKDLFVHQRENNDGNRRTKREILSHWYDKNIVRTVPLQGGYIFAS